MLSRKKKFLFLLLVVGIWAYGLRFPKGLGAGVLGLGAEI